MSYKKIIALMILVSTNINIINALTDSDIISNQNPASTSSPNYNKTYKLEKISEDRIKKAEEEILSLLSNRTKKFYALSTIGASVLLGSIYIASNYLNKRPAVNSIPACDHVGGNTGLRDGLAINKHRIVAYSSTAILTAIGERITSPFTNIFYSNISDYMLNKTTAIWFASTQTRLESCLQDLYCYCELYENSKNSSIREQEYFKKNLQIANNLAILEIEKVLAFMALDINKIDTTIDSDNYKLEKTRLSISFLKDETNKIAILIETINTPENLSGTVLISKNIKKYIENFYNILKESTYIVSNKFKIIKNLIN